MPSMYAVVAVIAIALVARIVGALVRTGDPNALWRHKARFAAGRIGWCLAVVALAGCDKGEPAQSSGPSFGADPAYASCQADPAVVGVDVCVSEGAYSCVTMPPFLSHGCYQPAAKTAPNLICCPSIAYDGGAS